MTGNKLSKIEKDFVIFCGINGIPVEIKNVFPKTDIYKQLYVFIDEHWHGVRICDSVAKKHRTSCFNIIIKEIRQSKEIIDKIKNDDWESLHYAFQTFTLNE